jgi:nucleoside-diphosphate kinase
MFRRATVSLMRLGVASGTPKHVMVAAPRAMATTAAEAGSGTGARTAAAAAAFAAAFAAVGSSSFLPLSARADAPAAAKPAAAAAPAAPPGPERTFIMVKPDGVERRLVAEVVKRFEQRGYRLAAAKVILPTAALADEHYAEHRGKPFQPSLVEFLSSGPVFAMVWEGQGVVKAGRAMIGATNPQASAPGTIRGDLAVATSRNIIHGSDGLESAQREIALWFPGRGEVVSFYPTDAKHTLAYAA